MSENRISEGALVTLEGATAASNIAAGTLVGLGTGTNLIYSLDASIVAFVSGSSIVGGRCLGVLDETISAGQSPVTIWTKGVFKFILNSGSTMTASAMIGKPVYAANSGGGTLVDFTGITGDQAIGTVVGYPLGLTELSGQYINVKINPPGLLWGTYGETTVGSGTGYVGHAYPPLK